MAITAAYDRELKGWTSEFSFTQMNGGISLNNNYYTFQAGEIWRHNDPSQPYNTFYGIHTPTEVVFIFNDEQSSVKNFKTLNFEGTGDWNVTIATDQESGQINAVDFVNREGKQVAYVRGNDNQFGNLDLKSTSVRGAGMFLNPSVNGGSGTFQLSDVPDSLDIGDIIYRSTITGEAGGTPELVGRVTDIDHSTNTVTLGDIAGIEQNPDGSLRSFFTPTTNDLVLYLKSGNVEKSGLIGFFAIVTMTNSSTTEAELFSASSEVFISSK